MSEHQCTAGLKRKSSDSGCISGGGPAKRPAQSPGTTSGASATARGAGFWQNGLKLAVADSSQALFSDSECVIIADKYPKAKHHYLVMPSRQVESLTSLTSRDAPLLRHMLAAARQFIADKSLDEKVFRFGFHAVPSMGLLHMHAVSQDFVSPCLKNKKHWLSFTSRFFLDCDSLLRVLEPSAGSGTDAKPLGAKVTLADGGRLAIDRAWFSDLVKQGELRCNQCARVCKNMPDLKSHLIQHQQLANG